jgi:hypothetical protein
MKTALKKMFSKRAIVIVLAALLVLSAFNTYLIIEDTRSSLTTSTVNYEYVLSQNGNNYKLKNMLTGYVADEPASASDAFNSALSEGKSIYVNPGTYVLTDDVVVSNKLNAKIVGDGATILGNGHKIIVYGDTYTASQRSLISGLTLINATIRVENSFATTITNIVFENTSTGIEFANTNTWTEYNKVENCQFINATEGIAFRTPVGNGTGSYASSEIDRCSFNQQDYSVGINVEPLAEFSDSQIQNVRFWLGADGETNQTGLLVDGSMYQTLLFGVVFESFTPEPVYMFGIDMGATCNPAPILQSGVSFLGRWTAKVHNPFNIWLSSGDRTVFNRQDVHVPVGTNSQFGQNESIQVRPLTIYSFKPKIVVDGSFTQNETITVRIQVEYVDNYLSSPVIQTFNSSGSIWVSDNEMMRLIPSQSIVWAVWLDAKSSSSSTDATVTISGYGTAA